MYAKIAALLFLTALVSEARVLNLSEERFASYFALEAGRSLLKTTPFDQNLASVESYSDEHKLNVGGEFGFVYSSPYIAWRFSFEILKPSKLQDVQGLAGTSAQYLVSSDVTAVAPKIGLQLHLNKKPNNRFYLYGYYGTSNLTMTETYSAVVSPNSDHVVEAKGSSTVAGGGLGFEMSFVDTTAVIIEMGYRSLSFTEIKYSKDVSAFQGAKTAGDVLTNLNGENRSLNFSGYTVSIGFRFWL